jgi:glycogen debranching enzyme
MNEAVRDVAPEGGAGIIPALVSLPERRTRTLKHDDSFAVFDHNGDAISAPGRPEGIFHRDTRYLSQLYMTIGNQRPLLLSSSMRDDNAALDCDLTNPDFFEPSGKIALQHDLIHIRRSRFLWKGACFERLAIRNFDQIAHRVPIAIWFASDFADLFEVRGSQRPRRGTLDAPVIDDSEVRLAYAGLDGERRETVLRFDPRPTKLTARSALFDIDIAPGQSVPVFIEVHCGAPDNRPAGRDSFFGAMRDARRSLRRDTSRAARISSSNGVFDETANRALADLYMLVTSTSEGPYPYAGIPWFSAVFGRDALITAMETLWLDPTIALGVLKLLASLQADKLDPESESEPGKILHEARNGEMARLGEIPFGRYYGSVDSTPLFIMLAGAYLERTGDLEAIRSLWPNIEAALNWIDEYGDYDGDGFVEYGGGRPGGLANQGWKDSHDSVFYADGRLAAGPIALVEVQAYVYGALRAASLMAERLGSAERAEKLRQCAKGLREQFDARFFDAELGTYVLALDGDKTPCRVKTSNAGHALYTGIAYPERAASVVAALMTPASYSGWGVRTVAATEARYNPMSYHNGSVWPHDNAMIAAGFARYGYRRQAARIFDGLYAASVQADMRRLPELFCGFPRKGGQSPTSYPVACSPQAWAAATPLSLVRSCLGMIFDPAQKEITFDHATLPGFLDELVLRKLTVGDARVDIAVRRVGSETAINVIERTGAARVLIRS